MGLYDEVLFRCPVCDAIITHQSKAGDCHLTAFSLEELPEEIADELSEESVWCGECDAEIFFKVESVETYRAFPYIRR